MLAYVFGKRKDEVFLKLKALLEPLNIHQYYTDDWGAYQRHLDETKQPPAQAGGFKLRTESPGYASAKRCV